MVPVLNSDMLINFAGENVIAYSYFIIKYVKEFSFNTVSLFLKEFTTVMLGKETITKHCWKSFWQE